jgi:hypothetical protein
MAQKWLHSKLTRRKRGEWMAVRDGVGERRIHRRRWETTSAVFLSDVINRCTWTNSFMRLNWSDARELQYLWWNDAHSEWSESSGPPHFIWQRKYLNTSSKNACHAQAIASHLQKVSFPSCRCESGLQRQWIFCAKEESVANLNTT